MFNWSTWRQFAILINQFCIGDGYIQICVECSSIKAAKLNNDFNLVSIMHDKRRTQRNYAVDHTHALTYAHTNAHTRTHSHTFIHRQGQSDLLDNWISTLAAQIIISLSCAEWRRKQYLTKIELKCPLAEPSAARQMRCQWLSSMSNSILIYTIYQSDFSPKRCPQKMPLKAGGRGSD